MALDMNSFTDNMLRDRIVAQIEAAREGLTNEEADCDKTSQELENFLYGNAKSREEYMQLIATLVLHFNDKKRNLMRSRRFQEQQDEAGQEQSSGVEGAGATNS